MTRAFIVTPFQVDRGIHIYGTQSSAISRIEKKPFQNHNRSFARENVIASPDQTSSSFINPIRVLECLRAVGSSRERIHTLSKLQVLLTK